MAPNDFVRASLPIEDVDLSKPNQFLPLAVMIANSGPIVFTVSARPSYSSGTVADWLECLAREEGCLLGDLRPVRIGGLAAAACDATQPGDGITMRMRLALLENGGRLFQLSAMAPLQLWEAAHPRLEHMLQSFELIEDHGSAVPVFSYWVPRFETHHLTPEAAAHALRYAEDVLQDDPSGTN